MRTTTLNLPDSSLTLLRSGRVCTGGTARQYEIRARDQARMSRRFSVAATLTAAILVAPPAFAQMGLFERLATDRLAPVQPGVYLAGDKIKFQLSPSGSNFLLRFDGNAEVFALYSDRASMGSRLLKYDSGETAIRVAGWGALTLYTDLQPNGLPAVRVADASLQPRQPLTVEEIEKIASDETQHLAYARKLRVLFTADWSVLETNAYLRAMALDAMENAARGLDRFARSHTSRDAIAKAIKTVTLATGRRPTISLHEKTLIVTFNPERGYFGRASSRAIARALATVLARAKKAN